VVGRGRMDGLTLSPPRPRSVRHLWTILSGFPLAMSILVMLRNGIRPRELVPQQRERQLQL